MHEMVKGGKNTLSQWISNQIITQNPEKITIELNQIRTYSKGLFEFLYGYIYNYTEYLDNGARMIGGKFESMYWMLRTLDNLKYYRKTELSKILYNQEAG